MMQQLNSGDLSYRFTANRLCLDFLATKGEVGHRDIERIGTPQAYSSWIAAAGILDRDVFVGPADVADAIRFRELLRSYFSQMARGLAPDQLTIAEINEAARRPSPRFELNKLGVAVAKRADVAGQAALSSVARDVLLLVSENLLGRVKQCSDPTCNMYFLDNSRGNNRIWCATVGRGCGNKAKKRAFRARKREPA
ncbi:CGNR zinc finger domain-containing protein [Pararhizobium qamdonense]|uniref:CGNR zinc finger domain-containing protein n=1 Tax=Pararhizobium qamdonense TaxID=3031126 RepID=UPI0023E11813|nr:CGNR zinc finger domain-containing protein [Pararhizobium qamdonense]